MLAYLSSYSSVNALIDTFSSLTLFPQKLKSILYIPQMDDKIIKKWYEPLVLKAKDYDFNEPVDRSNRNFWQGVGAKIYDDDEEIKCILHVNTNLIITYDGKLIGRQTDEGIIYVEDLDPKIIKWYRDCGF